MRVPLLALLAVLVFPTAAEATLTVTVGAEGRMIAVSDSAVGSRIVVSSDEEKVSVAGANEPLVAEAPCTVAGDVASCPSDDVERLTLDLGAGDDVLLPSVAPLPIEALGGSGEDELHGGVDADKLEGGPDDDVLDSADVPVAGDDLLDCGTGRDRIDADNFMDPEPVDCEAVAPEWYGLPKLRSDVVWKVGHLFGLTGFGVTGSESDIRIRWKHCSPDGSCTTTGFGDLGGWTLRDEDVGKRLSAVVEARNAAGSVETETAQSPIVEPGPPEPSVPLPGPPFALPGPPVREPRPPVVRPVLPKPVLGEQIAARSQAEMAAAVGPLAALFARRDPRRIGRVVPHTVTLPEDGRIRVDWTVPAAVARRYGIRTTKRLLVARGASWGGGKRGQSAKVEVTVTKLGRRLLARAPSVKVTLTLIKPRHGLIPAASASAPFTLRRRG